ncbi:MAG: hypothetical protein HYW27_00205 [Candidatus Aenigmarchaeota archaeon]|nr:hypothetical protein [Candidatus Aenigmarchaeota archaeon]
MDRKRLTALKTRLSGISGGRFVQQDGFNPSYVVTPLGERLSRVRILSVVVDKFAAETGKFASLTIDDGTDTIRVKVFSALSMIENIVPGDTVDVIGRIKEYNGELYIAPEVITKVSDPNFEILRELEIRRREKNLGGMRETILKHKEQASDVDELARMMVERYGMEHEFVEDILAQEEGGKPSVDAKKSVMDMIESLDKGEGCDYTDLIASSGLGENEIDKAVQELLEEGLCYEPRPGKIRRL